MPPSHAAASNERPFDDAERIAVHGDLLDFSAEPAWGDVDSTAVRFRASHWLLVDRGRITMHPALDRKDRRRLQVGPRPCRPLQALRLDDLSR